MRRGWHENWDVVDKGVWTTVAVTWALILGYCLILSAMSYVPALVALRDQIQPGKLIPIAIVAHLFVYALMWLRRMFAKSSGKNRDR